VEYADVQAGLPGHHRDPFDRLLAAQAQVEGLSVLSGDSVFDGVRSVRRASDLAAGRVNGGTRRTA
jgi:PIN domain nuclease of toxin-antitoxin system